MTDFKIGGLPHQPTSGIAGGGTVREKETTQSAASARSGFDTASVNPNRLAVMPRISSVDGQSAQHVRGKTVESLLRDSAAELDDYFTMAYGFQE